jgi:MFS family permease
VNSLITKYAGFLGAGAGLIGIISGLYFGVACASRPFAGPAITMANKKKLMIWVYIAGVVTNLIYAVAGSVGVFIIARILHGLQFAFVGSLGLTIASDSVPREKLGSAVGLYGAGAALAMALGPGMGVGLRDWAVNRWDEAAGYTAVFLLAAAFMFLAIIPTLIMPDPGRPERSALGAWYKNIIAKEALLPTVMMGLVSMSSTMFNVYMVPYAKTMGIPNIAIFFTVYAFVLLAARPFFGKLADRVSMEKVLIPSLIVFALSYVAVALGRNLGMMLLGAVLAAIGFGAANPSIQTLCIRSVEPERRGVASNTQFFGMDLGYFIGPLIGGMILNARVDDYPAMYLCTGVIPQVICLILFIATWGRLKKRLY